MLDSDGLYNLAAREYDPGSGRFLQRDPQPQADTEPSVGTYVYVADRPTVLVDPTGKFATGASNEWAQFAATGNPFDVYSARHNMALLATVTEVRKRYGPAADFGVEWENSIPGAGRRGGTGYPDIKLRTGAETLVWDVKPYSPTGIKAGQTQLTRYLDNLPKSAHGRRGDPLPRRNGVPVSFTEYSTSTPGASWTAQPAWSSTGSTRATSGRRSSQCACPSSTSTVSVSTGGEGSSARRS